ncbi:MAG: YbaK/EbsC family protein [Geobacteraceae bacterium]|nr:YbaK/EbsC family protein [Geobacteraceae bacterium]
MMHVAEQKTAYERIVERIDGSGFPYQMHDHVATRTVDDAERNLSFDVRRIVKTVAFRTRSGAVILAALRGVRRVNYARLAALLEINRRDLAALSPDQVRQLLGVDPGSVSPFSLGPDTLIFIDSEVLDIRPTLYCGTGRPDRTLELTPADLVGVTGGRIGAFSRSEE